MTVKKTLPSQNAVNPEKLSGHALVDYLIDNPSASGNFKWHTLLSCMWRRLLTSQPAFANVVPHMAINPKDIYRILAERPELASGLDWLRMSIEDRVDILIKHPDLANHERTKGFNGRNWSQLLKRRPELADLCAWEKFNSYDWTNLLSSQTSFISRCSLNTFSFRCWTDLIEQKRACLRFFELKYIKSMSELGNILKTCYFGKAPAAKGLFEERPEEPADFILRKYMDKENGRRCLKRLYKSSAMRYDGVFSEKYDVSGDWDFIEKLCELSCEEASDIHGKKYLPFYVTLVAPDKIFQKLLPLWDLCAKDPAGNSLLMPALCYLWLMQNDEAKARYNFLIEQGLDPNEKNLAGFSCSNVIKKFSIAA